jgi:type IV secretion system protein VirD4
VSLAATRVGSQVFAGPPRAAIVLLVALASMATGVAAIVYRREHTSGDRAARFASRADLAPLRVRGPQAGRVILGAHRRALIAAEARASVLVVGPSQSGKTSGVVVPALLEWSGPALCTSIKSDVVRDTYVARERVGKVRVFDPTGATYVPHASWSPIAGSRTWEGARRMAARLLGVGDHGAGRSADEAFWRPAGARYLAPLLLAAAHGRDIAMRDVLSWVAGVGEDEPAELLASCAAPGASAALEALRSVWGSDSRFRSNLQQTVSTSLDAWQEPQITAATAGDSQIGADWLLDGANTLYLISPAEDQRRLRGLLCALVADVVAGAFARAAQSGRPVEPALLLCLDEAANIAPLPNLDEIASTGPGQGVQLLTVLQNMSQASDRWGSDRAETIVANHRARVFCSGIGDRATLEHLRQTLGEEQVARVSRQHAALMGAGSITVSQEHQPLAAPNRVRQAKVDRALLVYGNLPPAWLRLRPWYRDSRLRAVAAALPVPVPHATGLRLSSALGLIRRVAGRARRLSRPAAGGSP